jgi:hypothetical protein
MKYLLFVFGTYDENDFVLEKIGEIVSRISTSEVRYRLGATGGIFNFESLDSSDKIDEHLYSYLSLFSAMYFITPLTEDVIFGIQDEEICNQLMGPDEEHDILSETQGMEHNLESEPQNENRTMTEEEIRNFVKRIADIEEVLEKLTPPTLDQILDKINEVGINNLTEIETQLLNEYSKG